MPVPLLAGSLGATRREAVERHVEGCAACRAELAASRALVRRAGAAAHLTSDEIVEAAWTALHPGTSPTARGAGTRSRRYGLRPPTCGVVETPAAPVWQRPELAWAAALRSRSRRGSS